MQQNPRSPRNNARSLDGFRQPSKLPAQPTQKPASLRARTPQRMSRPIDSDFYAPQGSKISATNLSGYLKASPKGESPDFSRLKQRPELRRTSAKPANNTQVKQQIAPKPQAFGAQSNQKNTMVSTERRRPTEDIEESAKKSWRERRKAKKLAKAKHRKHPKLHKIMVRSAAAAGAIVLLFGGWMVYNLYNNAQKVLGGNLISNISGLVNDTPLKGQNEGRVNILLAGNSADKIGHGGADLTDSIMLVSLDTKNNKAFMLSIPRDFWVNIPDVGYRKINEAYYWGQENGFKEDGFAEGGMGLLAKTLKTNLDVEVHYNTLINYTAFKDSVDAVGGITVDIQSTDSRGLYDPTFKSWEGGALKLANGQQELDGNTALKLARARGHDGGYGYSRSDFVRTENQRKMLLALKDKALSAGTLSNPIKITNLMNSIGDNIQTDFKTGEVKTLVGLGNKIKDIESLSMQDSEKNIMLLSNYTSPAGQSALIPSAGLGNYNDIILFLKQNMSSDPVVQEGSVVSIFNGTETNGLAKTQESVMLEKGLSVDSIDSTSVYAQTTIVDASGGKKSKTLAWLKGLYKNSTIVTESPVTVPENVDFVIILGTDFANAQSTSSQ